MITITQRSKTALSPSFDSNDHPHRCMMLLSQIIIGCSGLLVLLSMPFTKKKKHLQKSHICFTVIRFWMFLHLRSNNTAICQFNYNNDQNCCCLAQYLVSLCWNPITTLKWDNFFWITYWVDWCRGVFRDRVCWSLTLSPLAPASPRGPCSPGGPCKNKDIYWIKLLFKARITWPRTN